jgi:antitoxin component of MazEF toxin-antitoxin module
MTRKIVQTGSSLAVTLPSEVVQQFKLKKGDEVEVSVHPQTGAIMIRTGITYVDDGKMSTRVKKVAAELRRSRTRAYAELAK